MNETVLIVIALVQFIVIIVFVVMARNVAKIKAQLKKNNSYRKYWIARKKGNFDVAYEYLLEDYLSDKYDELILGKERIGIEKKEREQIVRICEEMGKEPFDFDEIIKR